MALSAQNLTVGYGDKRIFDGLSLTLPTGKITALLGPNGCGKSTLLKCFSRLLMPQSGALTLDGAPLSRFSARQLARRLALLPQHQATPEGISVRELVAYGRNPWLPLWGRLSATDKARVQAALEQTGLASFAGKMLDALSGGQRQRAFLAMVLVQDTPLILLDEPTTWLDINHQVALMNMLRTLNQAGKTVVTVLHDINQACRYCDHLVVLNQGQVVAQGEPWQVMTPALLKQVFLVEAQVHADPVSGTPWCVMR